MISIVFALFCVLWFGIGITLYMVLLRLVLNKVYKFKKETIAQLNTVLSRYGILYGLLFIPNVYAGYQDTLDYYLIDWTYLSLWLFVLLTIIVNAYFYYYICSLINAKEKFKLWYILTICYTVFWFFIYRPFRGSFKSWLIVYLVYFVTILVGVYNPYTSDKFKLHNNLEEQNDENNG